LQPQGNGALPKAVHVREIHLQIDVEERLKSSIEVS
jgi:hypothetical protein